MDTKNWWQSKTIWSALISAVAGLLAVTGHNIDPGTQSVLVNALVNVADGVAVIASMAAAYYRTKAQTAIVAPAPKE